MNAIIEKKPKAPLNGVDTPNLLATINAVGGQPDLGEFQFRATTRWKSGTHSRTVIDSFAGAGGEHQHAREFQYDADHPAVLVGSDEGPTPVEFLLVALGSCLTAGIGNIAAVRGVKLDQVECRITGDINLLGLLGLNPEIRNGFQGIRVEFRISGDAPAERLAEIVEQSRRRSAVFDVFTNGIPVSITTITG